MKFVENTLTTLLLLLLLVSFLPAQETVPPNRLVLSGYVKQLQSGNFFNASFPDLHRGVLVDTFLMDNLLHQRLNGTWIATEKWSIHGGFRTRLFYGEVVKANPIYGQQIDGGSNDWWDLSALWLDNKSIIGHTVVDRLYAEYLHENWEIRAGRQRINWGISTVESQ
ncbi:MAG: hypothetical protein R2795_24270 [Saprospiraceae bacterium]